MKRFVHKVTTVFLCVFLLLPTVLCTASATTSTATLRVRQMSMGEILSAVESKSIDSLLFPHGVDLPTNYFDLMQFTASAGGGVEVPAQVWRMLSLHWPLEDESDSYTYAEVMSVYMYYVLCAVLMDQTTYPSADYTYSLEMLSSTSGFALVDRPTVAKILDYAKLKTVLLEYYSLLETPSHPEHVLQNHERYAGVIKADDTGIVHSLGYDSTWYDFVDGSIDTYGRDHVLNYIDSRPLFFEKIGVEFTPGVYDYMTAEQIKYYNGIPSYADIPVAGEKLFFDGELGDMYAGVELPEPVIPEPVQQTKQEDANPMEVIIPAPEYTQSVDEQTAPSTNVEINDIDIGAQDQDDYAASVSPNGIPSIDMPERKFGVKDIALIACIAICLCTAIGLVIGLWLKNRNDPTRRYKLW